MSVPDSCKFLNTDTFVPTGSQQEQAAQISKHYQEVADKVAPEVAAPIQKMADIMKQVADSPHGDPDGRADGPAHGTDQQDRRVLQVVARPAGPPQAERGPAHRLIWSGDPALL